MILDDENGRIHVTTPEGNQMFSIRIDGVKLMLTSKGAAITDKNLLNAAHHVLIKTADPKKQLRLALKYDAIDVTLKSHAMDSVCPVCNQKDVYLVERDLGDGLFGCWCGLCVDDPKYIDHRSDNCRWVCPDCGQAHKKFVKSTQCMHCGKAWEK